MERRHRLLAAPMVACSVLALPLFSDAAYGEVKRELVEDLARPSGWKIQWALPTRRRLRRRGAACGAGGS